MQEKRTNDGGDRLHAVASVAVVVADHGVCKFLNHAGECIKVGLDLDSVDVV